MTKYLRKYLRKSLWKSRDYILAHSVRESSRLPPLGRTSRQEECCEDCFIPWDVGSISPTPMTFFLFLEPPKVASLTRDQPFNAWAFGGAFPTQTIIIMLFFLIHQFDYLLTEVFEIKCHISQMCCDNCSDLLIITYQWKQWYR